MFRRSKFSPVSSMVIPFGYMAGPTGMSGASGRDGFRKRRDARMKDRGESSEVRADLFGHSGFLPRLKLTALNVSSALSRARYLEPVRCLRRDRELHGTHCS